MVQSIFIAAIKLRDRLAGETWFFFQVFRNLLLTYIKKKNTCVYIFYSLNSFKCQSNGNVHFDIQFRQFMTPTRKMLSKKQNLQYNLLDCIQLIEIIDHLYKPPFLLPFHWLISSTSMIANNRTFRCTNSRIYVETTEFRAALQWHRIETDICRLK